MTEKTSTLCSLLSKEICTLFLILNNYWALLHISMQSFIIIGLPFLHWFHNLFPLFSSTWIAWFLKFHFHFWAFFSSPKPCIFSLKCILTSVHIFPFSSREMNRRCIHQSLDAVLHTSTSVWRYLFQIFANEEVCQDRLVQIFFLYTLPLSLVLFSLADVVWQ